MIDPAPPLPGWSEDHLETTDDTVCVVDEQLIIRWTNSAWTRFADDNGGSPAVVEEWSRDVCYTDAMVDPLDAHFLGLWNRCRATDAPASHTYECSSPTEFREFRQTVYPVAGHGAVIVNSLVVARPHVDRDEVTPSDDADYRDENGYVRQCAECRRVRHVEHTRWDWIPNWLVEPPRNTSHVLCPPCLDRYSPSDAA